MRQKHTKSITLSFTAVVVIVLSTLVGFLLPHKQLDICRQCWRNDEFKLFWLGHRKTYQCFRCYKAWLYKTDLNLGFYQWQPRM